MKTDFASLYELFEAIPNEDAAIDHFTAIHWKHGAHCPTCGSVKVYHFAKKGIHKCGDCHKRFSIKVGTIFEGTKIPLRKWMAACWLITSNRKGIASTQLARDIAVTQKTAWFMLHRLRHAARTRQFNRTLKGHVEVDESAVGGKERNRHASKRQKGTTGFKGKAIVMGLLEREGELRTMVIPDTSAATVRPIVLANVEPGANLYTDGHHPYRVLGRIYQHGIVDHEQGEYARVGGIHTNSIEGVWAILKRQIMGTHHWMSPKHLHRYLAEITWRYTRRNSTEGGRVSEFLSRTHGRLRYVDLIAKV
jgi:transposase-like protein